MFEQTLNSQNHGVHYMSVITRLTCNNSILLTRNSQTDKPTEMTQLMTRFCVIVLGWRVYAYGLRAFTKETYIRLSWYMRDNVCDSFRDVITSSGLARVLHDHWSTSVPKYTDVWLCVTWRELTNHVPLFTLKIWNLITE